MGVSLLFTSAMRIMMITIYEMRYYKQMRLLGSDIIVCAVSTSSLLSAWHAVLCGTKFIIIIYFIVLQK